MRINKSIDVAYANERIGYEDGFIYYVEGKGYITEVYKRLKHRIKVIKEGAFFTVKDKDGNIVTKGISWINMLENLSKAMR